MKQAVLGIIFDNDETVILLIKRRDVPVWVLPGGGIDHPETAEDAIVREIKEETGLEVTIKRKVSEYTPLNRLTHFTHLFECEKKSGKLTKTSETCDVGFFPIHSLPDTFFHIHKDFLSDALKKSPHILKKNLHQVTYKELFKYLMKHPLRVLRFSLSKFGFPLNS